MLEEHHEEVVGNVVVGSYTLLFLREIVREGRLEVVRARGQNYLVAIDGFTLHHQCDVAELWMVQDCKEVLCIAT